MAVLGTDTPGVSNDYWAACVGIKVTAASSGTLNSISLLCDNANANASVKFALYDDVAGVATNRLATTAAGAQTNNAVTTLDLVTPYRIVAGTSYWLVVGCQVGATYFGTKYSTAAGIGASFTCTTYPPATIVFQQLINERLSIYGTYTLNSVDNTQAFLQPRFRRCARR
jgi:hypothetical protein